MAKASANTVPGLPVLVGFGGRHNMPQVLFPSVFLLLQLQELLLLHKSGWFFDISLSPLPQASQNLESTKDGLKQTVPITVQQYVLVLF